MPQTGNSMWHITLDQPTGPTPSPAASTKRSFANGQVLVNPFDSSGTVQLGGSYTDLEGSTVSSLTMAPHTGQIVSG
jgi:hypothetical protein